MQERMLRKRIPSPNVSFATKPVPDKAFDLTLDDR
jgi:hypothetical protein